jgi:hypothetical protein
MKLVKTIPHLGGLPEIFVFYCSRCKQAETKEQVVWQEASVRGWGLANRDAATASRSAPRGPRAAVVSIPACGRLTDDICRRDFVALRNRWRRLCAD